MYKVDGGSRYSWLIGNEIGHGNYCAIGAL